MLSKVLDLDSWFRP